MRPLFGLIAAALLALLCAACNNPAVEITPTPEVKNLVASPRAMTPVSTSTLPPTATSLPQPTSTSTPIPQASPTLPPQPPTGWKSYRNQEYGFELNYPPQAVLTEPEPDQIRIDLPFEPGTNLVEKYLQIDLRSDVEGCASPMAVGYDPGALQSENLLVNGSEFLKQSGSEGAAGNFYDWVGYSTTRDNTCISLTFVLHSLDPYNFETPPPTFDIPGESAVFELMLASFMWLP